MELSFELNYVAIVLATVAAYVLGWIWHGPLFGKKWMALEGLTPESMKAMPMSPQKAMTLGFVATFLTAWVLGWVMAALGVVGILAAVQAAFWVWLGFVMPTLASKWLWEGKSFALFGFNAAHGLVALVVMAIVISLW